MYIFDNTEGIIPNEKKVIIGKVTLDKKKSFTYGQAYRYKINRFEKISVHAP